MKDLHVEPMGGLTRLEANTTIEKLGPSKEDYEVLTLALKVLLADRDTLHCSNDERGCSHQSARNLIAVLTFPTLFVKEKKP